MASPGDSDTNKQKTLHDHRERKLTKLTKEGYSNKFVNSSIFDEVTLDIECAFCFMVMRDARQISCGHSFCATCWGDWESAKKSGEAVRCPIDDIVVMQVFVDRKQDRLIGGLKVYCDNLDSGCKDTPELRYLEAHLEKCEYQTVSCQRECGLKVLLCQLEDHMERECPRRIMDCGLCGASMNALYFLSHGDICPMKLVSCEFCQSGRFPRHELPTHQHTDCPKFPTLCSFALVGCTEKVLRYALEAHHAAHTDEHLHLLNASHLYHTTGVISPECYTSRYELPSALWGRVCEDGTNVSWDMLPGCVVEEGGGEVALCEKVNLLEQKNDELASENRQLMKNIGHLERKMGHVREVFKTNEEKMRRKIQELNANEEMLARNMNEMRENMELEMRKSKAEMEKNIEEVKKGMEEMKHALAAEKATAEKAAAEPKVLMEGRCNECPCYWKVKLGRNMLTKYSPPFYTSDGYKMFFVSDTNWLGAVLHKADGDESRIWPWDGPERMTVVGANTGVKLLDCDLVSLGHGGRTRPTSETYRTFGHWLFGKVVSDDMLHKTVKLIMKKKYTCISAI